MSSVRNASRNPSTSSALAVSVGVPVAVTSTRLAIADSRCRIRRDEVEGLAGAREQRLAVGEPADDESDLDGLVDADAPSGVDELLRAGEADRSGQTNRAAEAGDETELHLGLAEARGICRVDEVAGERELEAAAEREAVDARR